MEDDGKSCHDLISMVLDLSLTLSEYAKETGIHVHARIGIHGDEIPTDCSDDLEGVEAAWTSLVNTAYHLSTISTTSILLTEIVKDYAEDEFRFLPRGSIYTRGIGACKIFALIGADDGDGGEGLADVEERARRAREAAEAALTGGGAEEGKGEGKEKGEKVKSKACLVM
ncbi:hypothetical protein HDU67_006616 [Dinochytrium kinnereticum]|nr:hypothetical protein HDU67_006616 [Dinochytrium kinnereticum]